MLRIVRAAVILFATVAVKGFAQGQTVNLNYKVKRFSLPDTNVMPVRPMDGSAEKARSAFYANGFVNLRGMDLPASIRVLDIRGRLVSADAARNGRFGFAGHTSGVYQVLAEAEGKTLRFRFVAP